MKAIINKISVKFALLASVAALCTSALTSCEKDSDLELPLAVNSNNLALEAKGGSTHVMIYSTTDWTARFDAPVEWASLNVLSGTGNSDVVFAYSENLEASRRVKLIIENRHGADTILMVQKGFATQLAFKQTEISVPKIKSRISIPYTTNLKERLKDVDVLVSPEAVARVSNVKISTTDLSFDLQANTSDEPFSFPVKLSFIDGDLNTTTTSVVVTQGTEDATFAFASPELVVARGANTISLPLETNLIYSSKYATATVEYLPEGTEWVSDVAFDGENCTLNISENDGGANRKAIIKATFDNGDGVTFSTQTELVQYTIDKIDLRLLVAGESGSALIEDNIVIDAYVISDAGNGNMETNPNSTLTKIDYTPNSKTAYVEMTDGSYGYRLQFANAADNTLLRYGKVSLSAKGMTIIKEANPTRYTLSGVTATNIAGFTEGSASDLPVKAKSITELTDDDIYTFVSIKDVQIGINDGAYTNVHDGYQAQYTIDGTLHNPNGTSATEARYDCSTLGFFDKTGNHINMLVNCMVPWRRTGSGVPAGSGTLSGIVVNTTLLRFGPKGDVGRYAIRPLAESDINLNASTGFAKTLVEWNWNAKVINKNTDGSLSPDQGEGSLYSTIAAAESTPYGLCASYNNKVNNDGTKGSLANTGVNFLCSAANSWWNFSTNKGEAIISEFSTSGINASSMVLVFDINGGSGSTTTNKFPTNWHIEYSTDGVTYTSVDNSDFCIRPLVWWTNTGLYCSPGNIGYIIKLPASALSNRDKVFVALRPTSTAYCKGNDNNASGAENGTLTAGISQAGNVRMSTYSIKYY